MKCVKTLAATAVIAAALLSQPSSALATNLTSPSGTVYTGTTLTTGHITIINAVATTTCKKAPTHTHSWVTFLKRVKTKLTPWKMSECDISSPKELKAGEITIESTGGGNGTVRSTGAEFTTESVGISCLYATNETPIGTFTSGSPATIDISASIPRVGHSFFCGSSGSLTGTYTFTSPSSLSVD